MKRRWMWLGTAALIGIIVWLIVPRQLYNLRRARALETLTARPDWQAWKEDFNQRKVAAAAIFEGATKVESFRMVPMHTHTSVKPIGRIDGFSYSAVGLTKDHDFATRLGSIVLNPQAITRSSKLCAFNPTVGLRVWKNNQSVTVIICFHCAQLMILENDPEVPINNIGGVKGRFRIGGLFDQFRPELVALAEEVFPNDPVIQSLKEIP